VAEAAEMGRNGKEEKQKQKERGLSNRLCHEPKTDEEAGDDEEEAEAGEAAEQQQLSCLAILSGC